MRVAVCCLAVVSLALLTGCPAGDVAVDFTSSVTGGSVPLSVTFTNTTDTSNLTVKSYLWAFGDGATSTEASPTHVYAAPGRYSVSLVLDTNKGTGTALKANYITAAGQFTVNVKNTGDYPITGVFLVEASALDWGSNRISSAIEAGDEADLGPTFQQSQYILAVVFDVNGSSEDVMLAGNLDTIGLAQDAVVTVEAFRMTNGDKGISTSVGD